MLTPGTRLGPYEVLSPIGAGGMGDVYLAEDSRLDRKVALKILPPTFADDKERMSRFLREAKAASALNHPNILTVHDVGESAGLRYIATEFIDGETLRSLIARGPLSVGPLVEIAVQAAAALNAAHAAGVVHRDIKPENVMVRADGLVKVLDFGLAKSDDERPVDPDGATVEKTAVTQAGVIMGTVAYMSPEQARGKAVDSRTDIWSLGVVIYEMLTARRPFEGESAADVVANILHGEPDFRAIPPSDALSELTDIVRHALAKDLDGRYQSSTDLLSSLTSLRKRLDFDTELERQSSPDRRAAAAQRRSAAAQPAAGPRQSIAVLPFTNMSADPENDYFCDGLAEELSNALAKIDGLKVAARTSAFAFRDKPTSVGEIGRALGVATVLEGSVRTSRSRMRIAVKLINVADGYHLWSERFDRETKDVFDVQDEITLAVVDSLKVRLFGDEKAAALKRGTQDADAYQLYLKGRYSWNKRTASSLRQAVELYGQAIERDPAYALAYAGLAESYVLYSWLSVAPPRESMPKARAAALRALSIDDTLTEAHAALGVYLCFYAWDQPASERALRRAVELNPRSATAHHWLGNTALLAMGRFDESIAAVKHAGELDPLSPSISTDTGVSLLYARRFDEALAQLRHALTLDPGFYVARSQMGQTLHAMGRYGEAIAEYETCLASDDDPWVHALLTASLARAGQREEAIRRRDRLLAESSRRYVPIVGLAIAHSALGDTEDALKCLEKDVEERSLYPAFYSVDTVFDDLRGHPGFVALVERVRAARMDSRS